VANPPWHRPTPPAAGWSVGTCVECGGSGEIDWRRCPPSQAGSFGCSVLELVRTMEAGFLPSSGGWTDQTALAGKCVRLCEAEHARIEQRIEEKRGELARVMDAGA
jgi:hypothetical protein